MTGVLLEPSYVVGYSVVGFFYFFPNAKSLLVFCSYVRNSWKGIVITKLSKPTSANTTIYVCDILHPWWVNGLVRLLPKDGLSLRENFQPCTQRLEKMNNAK